MPEQVLLRITQLDVGGEQQRVVYPAGSSARVGTITAELCSAATVALMVAMIIDQSRLSGSEHPIVQCITPPDGPLRLVHSNYYGPGAIKNGAADPTAYYLYEVTPIREGDPHFQAIVRMVVMAMTSSCGLRRNQIAAGIPEWSWPLEM